LSCVAEARICRDRLFTYFNLSDKYYHDLKMIKQKKTEIIVSVTVCRRLCAVHGHFTLHIVIVQSKEENDTNVIVCLPVQYLFAIFKTNFCEDLIVSFAFEDRCSLFLF